MRRYAGAWRSLAALLLLAQVGMAYAEKLTEVSDEFLEYLASLEGDDENWTDFVPAAVAPKQSASSSQPTAKSAASSSASSTAGAMSKATIQSSKQSSGKVQQ